MRPRWPRALRTFDRWLLTQHPDWWMSRLHVLIAIYPLLLGIILAVVLAWPMQLSALPRSDLAELVIPVSLILIAFWALWVGLLQIEQPVREGKKGWLDIVRFASGFALLGSLGVLFLAALDARMGDLVEEPVFMTDNAVLRSVRVRVDGRVLGLSYEGTNDPVPVENLTAQNIQEWLSVLHRYATTEEYGFVRLELARTLIYQRRAALDSIMFEYEEAIYGLLPPEVWLPVSDTRSASDSLPGFPFEELDRAALAARGLSLQDVRDSIAVLDRAGVIALAAADAAFVIWVTPLMEAAEMERLKGVLQAVEPGERTTEPAPAAFIDEVDRQLRAAAAALGGESVPLNISYRMDRIGRAISGERRSVTLAEDFSVLVFGCWYAGLIVFLLVRMSRLLRRRTVGILAMVASALWVLGTAYTVYQDMPQMVYASAGLVAPWWLRQDPMIWGIVAPPIIASVLLGVALLRSRAEQLLLGALLTGVVFLPPALLVVLEHWDLVFPRDMTRTGGLLRVGLACLGMIALGQATQTLLNRERARPA